MDVSAGLVHRIVGEVYSHGDGKLQKRRRLECLALSVDGIQDVHLMCALRVLAPDHCGNPEGVAMGRA